METRLTKISNELRIDPKHLYPNEYLVSLLNEAQEVGLISETDAEEIQIQIMDVLQWMITRYNGANSSSIKVEAAERLLLSVLYCLDVYCLSIGSPEECLEILKGSDMKEIYKQGHQLVKRYLLDAKDLYARVLKSRIKTSVLAYNSTIDQAIPEFFAEYDVNFSTHDGMGGIDYPLAVDDQNTTSLLYIHQYLMKLDLENQFCNLYPEEEIESLLESYGELYRIDYPEYLFNIFEIVLTNSIFTVMMGNDVRKILISGDDLSRLRLDMAGLDYVDISQRFRRALDQVIEVLAIEDILLSQYIVRYSKQLYYRFAAAIRQDTLPSLIISDSLSAADQPVLKFMQGESMDDEDFRQMVGQVLGSQNPAEKAEIILTSICSMIDFIDVLKADCIFGEEYHTVFSYLGDMELGVLAKYVFAEELREGTASLAQIINKATDSDVEWIKQLTLYLQGKNNKSRLKKIEDIARQFG